MNSGEQGNIDNHLIEHELCEVPQLV